MSVTPQDFDREAGEALRAYRVAPPSRAWAQVEARLPAQRPRRPLIAWLWPFGVALGVLATTLLTGLTAEDESLPDALAPAPPLAALPVDLLGNHATAGHATISSAGAQALAVDERPASDGADRPRATPSAATVPAQMAGSTVPLRSGDDPAELGAEQRDRIQQRGVSERVAATAQSTSVTADALEPAAPPQDLADLEHGAAHDLTVPNPTPVACYFEVAGVGLLDLRRLEPLAFDPPADARVPHAVLKSAGSAWALYAGLASRAYVSGDAERLRVEETPFGIGSFDDQDGQAEGYSVELVPVDVFADPLAVVATFVDLEHRSGMTAGIRLSGGARRLDIRASRERLLVLAAAATLGYRHQLGRWTPYGYAVAEHIRQERVTGYVTQEVADVITVNPEPLSASAFGLATAPVANFERLTDDADDLLDGRWHGATSLGFGLGLDYALNPRWQIGANGEYLHERIALGGALRVRLGK